MKDTLLFKPNQEPLANQIFNTIIRIDTYPCSVSIGGKSGSGKSEIASIVKSCLGKHGKYTQIVTQDSYYKTGHESLRVDTSLESIGRDELCWTSIKNAMMNLHHCKIYEVIILEGLYACSYPSDLKFYISQSYDDSYNFRKERGKEDPDSEHRIKVLEKEGDEVRKTKEGCRILTYEEDL